MSVLRWARQSAKPVYVSGVVIDSGTTWKLLFFLPFSMKYGINNYLGKG